MKINLSTLIKKREALEKARHEYHSFMSVRSIKDINANYKLLNQSLELENRLVKASNEVTRIVNSIK